METGRTETKDYCYCSQNQESTQKTTTVRTAPKNRKLEKKKKMETIKIK